MKNNKIFIVIYINNFLIVGLNKNKIKNLKVALNKRF